MSRRSRVLFVSGTRGGGTLRYRVRLAQEALDTAGWASRAFSFTDASAGQFLPGADVLALYRVPRTQWLAELVRRARKAGMPVTYDVDDLVFKPEHLADLEFLTALPKAQRDVFETNVPLAEAAARWADAGSGTSQAIIHQLNSIVPGPGSLMPNGIGQRALRAAMAINAAHRAPVSGPIWLGYFSGSNTHDADWKCIEPAVRACLRDIPQLRLRLVGPVGAGSLCDDFPDRIEVIPSVAWDELFPPLASVDVNLAPLTGNPFTEGKSAIKWLEAALVRTPTIATATEPNRAAITGGVDGELVNVGSDWAPAIHALASDRHLRQQLGDAAYENALATYGPAIQSRRYDDYFRCVVLAGPTQPLLPHAMYRHPRTGRALESYPLAESVADDTWIARPQDKVRYATERVGSLPLGAISHLRSRNKK